MDKTAIRIPLGDMVICLSDAVDMVSRQVANHHKRVAMFGHAIAKEMGLNAGPVNDVLMAGLVHDVGALTLQERLDLLQFEEAPGDRHSERGYSLLGIFWPFTRIADIVRYHHLSWAHTHRWVPIESHILHLADRISVLVRDDREPIGQADFIRGRIGTLTPTRFAPGAVEAFMMASLDDGFWLDTVSLDIDARLHKLVEPLNVEISGDDLLSLAMLFGAVVDFRSRFTSVHTAGVASVAGTLAGLAGMDEDDGWKMQVAGHLHDLGKLAVPVEIIEKPGKLDAAESELMKRHTYYTYSLLSRLSGLEDINRWASFHHERLDGRGYPFQKGASELSLGSRIMSVADVFTALTEDRPYRPGMVPDMALRVMDWMSENGALDPAIIETLSTNMAAVNQERGMAQGNARLMYETFMEQAADAA
jgi:HD-GYP domain-containing protein (c-di-GMP phosphodiesterase class II)